MLGKICCPIPSLISHERIATEGDELEVGMTIFTEKMNEGERRILIFARGAVFLPVMQVTK